MPRLRFLNGPQAGLIHELKGGEVLGRDPNVATLHVESSKASRSHCRVVRVEPYFFLIDLESQNGTFVNGVQIQKALLRDGDRLRVGLAELAFEDGRPEVRSHGQSVSHSGEVRHYDMNYGRDPQPGSPLSGAVPADPLGNAVILPRDRTPQDGAQPAPREPEREPERAEGGEGEGRLLDRLGRDLTALAREGALDPLIGRREELRRLGRILLQRRKPNAVLVGEPGVGKTCLVEGLAQQIVAPDGPARFRGARVVELSIGDLVAGTKYRGEMEERVQQLVRELREEANLILFLDELHLVMGLGRTENSNVDVANLLKPVLARAGVRLIGATTPEEYERYVARDRAFARRFEVVWVEEPTREETLLILERLMPDFSAHHGVEIRPEALEAAVDLSRRYIPDRRLPDKALDLIDQACSRSVLGTFRLLRAEEQDLPCDEVGPQQIADVIAERCRVPRERLLVNETGRLEGLGPALRERVIGQEAAIDSLVATLRSARAGLRAPDRPLASFLFIGPSGVGKTELAKALTDYLFEDPDHLLRIDMSELMERHSVSKLIGAPPGYVGHGEEGQLTGPIRRTPYAVILLDEVEKAHPQVLDILLQLLDEGRVTDALGRPASFREAIVILSSNLGASPWEQARGGLGFGGEGDAQAPSASRVALEEHLRPELLNRIDRVLEFQALDIAALEAVVEREVESLRERLGGRLRLEVTPAAKRALAQEGYDPRYGARELRREVEAHLSQPLAEALVAGGAPPGTLMRLDLVEGEFSLEVVGE